MIDGIIDMDYNTELNKGKTKTVISAVKGNSNEDYGQCLSDRWQL